MVTLQKSDGTTIEAEGEVVDSLAQTTQLLQHQLRLSTVLLRVLIGHHVEQDHDGDWDADCGMLALLATNEKLIEFNRQTNSGAPVGATLN